MADLENENDQERWGFIKIGPFFICSLLIHIKASDLIRLTTTLNDWSEMIRNKANSTSVLQMGVRVAKPPETLDDFYVTANEIYWNFTIFSFSPTFALICTMCCFRKILGGGLSPPSPPPLPTLRCIRYRCINECYFCLIILSLSRISY